jgi:hypothetical protein
MLVAVVGAGSASADIITVPGFRAPGTPLKYDQVQVRRYGSPRARKVLVLVPGTLAGAGYFNLVATYLVAHVPDLQVWAEMRREGALEDNSVLLGGLAGTASLQQVFDYYLGWLANPSISPHYEPLQASQFGFVKQWGLNVAMEDLHDVIERARDGGRRTVILGGHSLGGGETAIYAAWNFHGHPGYKTIAGMVGIDGGPFANFGGPPETVALVRQQIAEMNVKGPWMDLLGLGLPWVSGAFAEVDALAALKDPDGPSILQPFPLLPADLKPPVPVTNAASLGYAFDQSTSPAALALIHVHSGHLATGGNPVGWVNSGPTPVQDIADAFSIEPLGPIDWYYPERLTIDATAALGLSETATARYLGLHLKYLHRVDVPYYVIETSLGASSGLAAGARRFQRESRIPSLELVDRQSSYSHLDPLLAAPAHNAFLRTVVPWLRRIPLRR